MPDVREFIGGDNSTQYKMRTTHPIVSPFAAVESRIASLSTNVPSFKTCIELNIRWPSSFRNWAMFDFDIQKKRSAIFSKKKFVVRTRVHSYFVPFKVLSVWKRDCTQLIYMKRLWEFRRWSHRMHSFLFAFLRILRTSSSSFVQLTKIVDRVIFFTDSQCGAITNFMTFSTQTSEYFTLILVHWAEVRQATRL